MKKFREFEMKSNSTENVVGGASAGIKFCKHNNENGTIIKIEWVSKKKSSGTKL